MHARMHAGGRRAAMPSHTPPPPLPACPCPSSQVATEVCLMLLLFGNLCGDLCLLADMGTIAVRQLFPEAQQVWGGVFLSSLLVICWGDAAAAYSHAAAAVLHERANKCNRRGVQHGRRRSCLLLAAQRQAWPWRGAMLATTRAPPSSGVCLSPCLAGCHRNLDRGWCVKPQHIYPYQLSISADIIPPPPPRHRPACCCASWWRAMAAPSWPSWR